MPGGGGGGGTQTTKQEFADEQKPFIEQIFGEAKQGFESIKDLPGVEGRVQASANLAGVPEALSLANRFKGQSSATQAVQNKLLTDLMSNTALKPLQETFAPTTGGIDVATTAAIQESLQPLTEQLNEQLIPQLRSAAIDAGAFEGTKFDETQGQILRDFLREGAGVSARLALGERARLDNLALQDLTSRRNVAPALLNAELNRIQAVPGLTDAAFRQELAPINLLSETGGVLQAAEQTELDETRLQRQEDISEAFTGLDEFARFIQGFGTPINQQVASRKGLNFGGLATGALGGALLAGPLGAPVALTAALGGLGGLFG